MRGRSSSRACLPVARRADVGLVLASLGLGTAVLCAPAAAPASPPPAPTATMGATVEQCLAAHEQAQLQRRAGKLLAARAELLTCSQDGCPTLARTDCVPWLGEVEREIPTVVVVAKDEKGGDLVNVRVLVDGQPWLTVLDGKSAPIDPGAHALRFESGTRPMVEQQIVVRTGEKDRRVEVLIASSAEAAADAKPPPPPLPVSPRPGSAQTAPDDGNDSAVPVAGYVLAATGVASLGAFAVLGLMAKGEADEYADTCGPTKTCDEDDVSSTRAKALAADITLAVGVAALGVGIGLIIWDQVREPEAVAARLELAPTLGGARGTLRIGF